MKKHNKIIAFVIIFSSIISAAFTGCGTKGSYTGSSRQGAVDGNTLETTKEIPAEAEEHTTEAVTKPIEPETEYNGLYWAVKTADGEDTVDWVRMHGFNGELYIEYDGKEVAVPWARHEMGTGEGGRFYVQDVTGDGYEDLIGAMMIREFHPFFVYDLKNGKDLSPYYCKNHDLYNGLYTKEEYASQINAVLEPLFEEGGENPVDVSYLKIIDVIECTTGGVCGEDGFFENGVLKFRYAGLWWHCTVEYDFTGGECNMRIDEAETRYGRLKKIFDVEGERVLEARVISSSEVDIANEDIEITISIHSFNGDAGVILKHKDWEEEQTVEDWHFRYDSDKVYFEYYDYDNDGVDELLYHTVLDGEDTVQIYEFEQ